MKKEKTQNSKLRTKESDDLRQEAGERLKGHRKIITEAHTQSEGDVRALVHELQVHQIELEMQNEELQRAKAEVEEMLNKYSNLYDFAPIGYFTLDEQGSILEVNLAGAGLLGVERQNLINRSFQLFVSSDRIPVFNTFCQKVLKTDIKQKCEVKLSRNDTTPVDALIEGIALQDSKDHIKQIQVAIIDITERKQIEEERLKIGKLESAGVLAWGMAHDFNNLLATILGNIYMAKQSVSQRDEAFEPLTIAEKATMMAHGLTNQLVTFAHGGGGIKKVVSIEELLREFVTVPLHGSNVQCEFFIPQDLWQAEINVEQVGHVIHNMVLNAREAMPEGGTITLRAENVVVRPNEGLPLNEGDYVRISIEDRGIGIQEGNLARIFDPYFSTKQRGAQKGMGLGLTTSYSIVRNHGGSIKVTSRVGVGTIFHIYFPAKKGT